MTRTITDHIVNPANDMLRISVDDGKGAGGASHLYTITGFNTASNTPCPITHTTISFQNGLINEVGVNGVTHEVLLAIVADRLRSFQAGEFACRENALALTKIEEACHWLQQRTLRRMRAGVEGTLQVMENEGQKKE